jgi:prepilin-type N-terminal cleavage/methylation domain-containing protein
MRHSRIRQGGGFSLIELIIVVVIIAIIGAVAAPKMSRGAAGANDSALIHDLHVLRKALEHYAGEHQGNYPSAESFNHQLTKRTDEAGNASGQSDAPYLYGPYLVEVPELPIGNGGSKVAAAPGSGVGWIYDATAGTIRANTTTEVDGKGVLYSSY